MQFIQKGCIAIVFVGMCIGVGMTPSSAHAQTTSSVEDMLALIERLTQQIQELQEQLQQARSDVYDVLKDGLVEGMSDDDIKRIQEVLATDPSIYPEGLTTGYFGTLTHAALKRFQERHELPATGVIDTDTQDLLEEYLKEKRRTGNTRDLLRSSGIKKRMELRVRRHCGEDSVRPFCERLRTKYSDDEEDDYEDNEDERDEDDDDGDTSDPTDVARDSEEEYDENNNDDQDDDDNDSTDDREDSDDEEDDTEDDS